MQNSHKICSKCKKQKPFSEFYLNKAKKLGIRSACKLCESSKKIEKLETTEKISEKQETYQIHFRLVKGCKTANEALFLIKSKMQLKAIENNLNYFNVESKMGYITIDAPGMDLQQFAKEIAYEEDMPTDEIEVEILSEHSKIFSAAERFGMNIDHIKIYKERSVLYLSECVILSEIDIENFARMAEIIIINK